MSDKQPTQSKTEPLPDEDRSNIKQPTQLKNLNSNEISKPLWIKISRSDFFSLIKDVIDNLDDKECLTTVDKRKYDLENAGIFLLEITTKKLSKDEAHKMHNVGALKHVKGKGKNKSNNIKSSFFEGVHLHYKDVPKEKEYEISNTERATLRRQSNDLFRYYFNYLSLNNMRSRLGYTKGEINKDQVYLIKKALTKIKNIVENVPEDRRFKIKEN